MNPEDWTYEDFKTYLFIYCSFADHLEIDKERKVAIEKVGLEKYNEIHAIIENDTDDVGINKIRKYVKHNNITEEKVNDLLWDVADMFLSDGVFHKLEKIFYHHLFPNICQIYQLYILFYAINWVS